MCQWTGSNVSTGSGSSPVQCQTIKYTSMGTGLLLIKPSRTNFNEILLKIATSLLKKCLLQHGAHFNQASLCWRINSLWPSDTIWWHRSRSTLVQVMACCLTAPSHYLNQCWLIISMVQWHLSESDFTRDAQPSITKISMKITCLCFNSSPPSATYMHQWIGSALVQNDNSLSPIWCQAII